MDTRSLLLYLSLKYQGDWEKIYHSIATKEDVDYNEVENTAKAFKGNFITIIDKEYPTVLQRTFRPPFVLFYQGNIDLLNSENIIGVLCGREVRREDYHNAELILNNDLNVTYLVGSAKNDMDKHILTFKKPTIAVLGHSLTARQPLENYESYDLVLTEVPPNVIEITQYTLMYRFRIIAGLCTKELVITAPKKSGVALAVNQTLEIGKDVLVVPKLEPELLNYQLLEEGAIGCVRANQLI